MLVSLSSAGVQPVCAGEPEGSRVEEEGRGPHLGEAELQWLLASGQLSRCGLENGQRAVEDGVLLNSPPATGASPLHPSFPVHAAASPDLKFQQMKRCLDYFQPSTALRE